MADDPWRRSPIQPCLCPESRRQDRARASARFTEAERYAVADHVVGQLKERGDPWGLSEEAGPHN